MRSLVSTFVPLIVLAGLSTPAAADDRQDCARASTEARIAACTRILSSNPADFNALANRGIAYRVNGDYDRALADTNAAMRVNANFAGLYLERGLAYEGRGDHERAIADLTEAIRRDGTLVSAYFGRAMAYEAVGDRDRAGADLDEAMRLDRNLVAGLYIQRGYAAKAARDYDKAIAAFDRAIELNGRWLITYFGRGASYEGRGDIERAVHDYHKTLEFEAKTALEQQRQQEAREHLDTLSRG
jgi:tetratricopeptide (TPR) repeat protein